MSAIRIALPFAAGLLLAGCGLAVPEIQENPADVDAGQRMVGSIVTNITCEVQDAIHNLYVDNPNGTFLDDWGVQITLSLTLDEKGAVSPSANWMPPSPASALFNLSGGATLSSDATRIDKLNSYYLVKELRGGKCDVRARPGGLFLMQSDLKLTEWLFDAVQADRTGMLPTAGLKTNVLSHEVKFEVLSSGNLTPAWKLTRVSVNPTGNLLSASRDRTHDLLITFGPAEKSVVQTVAQGKKRTVVVAAPSSQAAFLHLASEIGSAVAAGIRSGLSQ